MKTAMKVSLCAGCTGILVMIGVLVGISFAVLDTNEVGLNVNAFSQEVDTTTLWEAGTHFIGISNSFVKFPKTQQSVKFAAAGGDDGDPVGVRSADGLPMTISFSFNYQLALQVDSISNLYLSFGEMPSVHDMILRVSTNVIRSVASDFEAFEFFSSTATTSGQAIVSQSMFGNLTTDLSKFGINVQTFLLQDIGIPASFSAARAALTTAQQDQVQAANDAIVAQINARTSVDRAAQEAQLIITTAQANAATSVLTTEAAIDSMLARFSAQRDSYLAYKQQLNLSPEQLLTAIWLDAQEDMFTSNPASIVAVPVPNGLKL